MMILNEMNDGFYKFLNSNDIENRTRDYIEFKNGSLIEFKSSIAIRGGRHSREIDILYIDEIRENDISWNYISHLFNNFNKLIIVNTLPSDKIKYIFKDITKGKYLIKDINKNTDFITELRGFKIEKIREKYENRFKYNIPRESY